VFDNADRGIQLYPSARRVRVYENTIDGNGEGVLVGDGAERNIVTDNLITNSRARWNVETYNLHGRGNAVLSNCVQASTAAYSHRGGIAPGIERELRLQSNAAAAIRYANRANGDLRVLAKSAACDGKGAPDDVAAGPNG
jgi:parallel beta-helix repeat protein